jgi:hypothetical protein
LVWLVQNSDHFLASDLRLHSHSGDSGKTTTVKMEPDMKIESLRSLDDFLLESARFQVPTNFSNLTKRVKANLIYYQTNYFILIILLFALFSILRPKEMLLGTCVSLLLIIVITQVEMLREMQRKYPLLTVGFVILVTYLFLSLLGSVFVFMTSVLVPLLLTLLHASLRTRNIRNKLASQLDRVGLRKTPMGFILDELGCAFEGFED